MILYKRYSTEEYPAYDNYDAINVDKTAEIPMDWAGAMGVPITFLDKHNPEQFEILGTSDNGIVDAELKTTPGLRKKFVDDYYASGGTGSYREGNPTAGYYKDGAAKMAYKRIFVRHLRDGRSERQEYLQTAIQWIKDDGETVEDYMGAHQHDKTATALLNNFQSIINRVERVFPNYRRPMKGVDWGGLYGLLQDESLVDPEALEAETARLMVDDDVTRQAGIYPYLLTREERHLSIRAFTAAMKQKAFELQDGICKSCSKEFELSQMEADHITPWAEGGRTVEDNCQMLCRDCNRRKSDK
ncbi:MAG: HNH endonuclease [Gammaproteobacteria bacterium]|nr:HNH endonuclease [Gammaproteobacteria bacterium]